MSTRSGPGTTAELAPSDGGPFSSGLIGRRVAEDKGMCSLIRRVLSECAESQCMGPSTSFQSLSSRCSGSIQRTDWGDFGCGDVEIDDDGLVIASDQHAVQRFDGTCIDFLVGNVGRHIGVMCSCT